MNLFEANKLLQQKQGRKLELEDSIEQLLVKIKTERRYQRNLEKAHEILKQVGLETQKQLVYHISDVTSLALGSVFDDPYKLVLDFVERREKTECDLFFERDGNRIKPVDDAGVGAVDVAAFALRIASWSMMLPRTRNVILLDEPFKHLRGKIENERVFEMLQTVSKMLNIQIIMVGDEKVPKETIMQYADKVFLVDKIKGISKVSQL